MKKRADFACKVFCVGGMGVGKTSIILRYTQGFINDGEYLATIGTNLEIKTIQTYDRSVKVRFMDTAGQERYASLAKNSFQSTEGIFVVYDATNRESFERVDNWLANVD